MDNHLTTQEYWSDEWRAGRYPKQFNPSKASHYAYDRLFSEWLPNGRFNALEIGVGASIWPSRLERNFGYNVFGIDYSWSGCVSAQFNYDSSQPTKIVLGDVFEAPFSERSFEIIYSLGVVEHFSQPIRILSIATRLLKPGGTLLTIIPNKTGIAGITEKWINPENYRRHNPLTKEDLKLMYEELGLKQIQVKYFGPVALIGKSPRQMTLSIKLLIQIKMILHNYLFGPTYLRGLLTPSNKAFASYIAAFGRRATDD